MVGLSFEVFGIFKVFLKNHVFQSYGLERQFWLFYFWGWHYQAWEEKALEKAFVSKGGLLSCSWTLWLTTIHSAGSYNSRASPTGAPKIWDGSLARKTESLEVCFMARKERLLFPSGFLHSKVIITTKTEREDKFWISWQGKDPSFCPLQTGMPAQHTGWCLDLVTKQKCVKK